MKNKRKINIWTGLDEQKKKKKREIVLEGEKDRRRREHRCFQKKKFPPVREIKEKEEEVKGKKFSRILFLTKFIV